MTPLDDGTVDDGSNKPLGHQTEDGQLEVRQEADGSRIYAETELGQHDRWLRLAPDLFAKYMDILAQLEEQSAYVESRLREADSLRQSLEHRTLTLSAAVKRAEAAEARALQAEQERDQALRDKDFFSREVDKWCERECAVCPEDCSFEDKIKYETKRAESAEQALAQAREALRNLKRGTCWCEMGIGNPMARTHSRGCAQARAALAPADPGQEPRADQTAAPAEIALVLAHAEGLKANPWRDIETAPKDGTRILIAWHNSDHWEQRAAYWDREFEPESMDEIPDDGVVPYRGAWTDAAVQSFGYEEVKEYAPSHWQPLPPPPDSEPERSDLYEALWRVCRGADHWHARREEQGQ